MNKKEPDYLRKRKQLASRNNFERVVNDVFWIEHRCSTDTEIASVIGVSKGWVSQILGAPDSKKANTLKTLLDKVGTPENRRRIVYEWIRECFPETFLGMVDEYTFEGNVTSNTVLRIHNLARNNRNGSVITMTASLLDRTDEYKLRQGLLDSRIRSFRKMDRVGYALSVLRIALQEATNQGDLRRIAHLHLERVRMLMSIESTTPTDIQPIISNAKSLVLGAEPVPDIKHLYYVASDAAPVRLEAITAIIFAERKMLTLSSDQLKEYESFFKKEMMALPKEKRGVPLLLLARVNLLMGKRVAAQDLLDRCVKTTADTFVHVDGYASMVLDRIFEHHFKPDDVEDYYIDLSNHFTSRGDLYHRRITETRLATITNEAIEEDCGKKNPGQ